MLSCMASPSSTLMDSRRLAVGKNSRPQPLTILPDLRWLDDLQLYPDQPILDLPTPLPPSLSRWLAGERHAGSHVFWARLRTRSGRLLSAPRRGGCPVSGMEALSGSEASVLAWRYLGSHARARHSIARPLLPGRSRAHSPAPPQSADQVCTTTFRTKRFRSLRRCPRTAGRPRLPARMEDHFQPLSRRTSWIVSSGSAAGLLLLDHWSFRSRS